MKKKKNLFARTSGGDSPGDPTQFYADFPAPILVGSAPRLRRREFFDSDNDVGAKKSSTTARDRPQVALD